MASGQGDAPEEEFVEALVELRAGASVRDVAAWCSRHGIDVVPMVAGTLVTGSGRQFTEAFGVRLQSRTRSQTLPVPQELKDTVRSVTVLPIPTLGARGRIP